MRGHWKKPFLGALPLALALALCGCASTHSSEVHERIATISKGKKDKRNRYHSAVQVVVNEPIGEYGATSTPAEATEEEDEYYECSGVLVSPKLVLTAGHCVCKRRELRPRENNPPQAKIIVDASACARKVTVKTVTYNQPPAQQGQDIKEYEVAEVIPHPLLKLVFHVENEELRVESSDADLAVLRLKNPADASISIAQLATAEVELDKAVVLVGYGPLEEKGRYGTRRFGGNRITSKTKPRSSGGEDFYLGETSSSHVYEGDSGGGCFRDTAQGLELVGIAGSRARLRSGEVVSIFTSVYSHRKWLKEAGVDFRF